MTFTAKSVTISPSEFVDMVTTVGFAVEDHLSKSSAPADRFPAFQIHNYLCGNLNMSSQNTINFGKASLFWNALPWQKIKSPRPEDGSMPISVNSKTIKYELMPKGQGYPGDFIKVIEYVWANKEIFIKQPALKPYFDVPTLRAFLDKLDADNIIGWDCIGFVHQYLSWVDIVDEYLGYSALGYTTRFKPIGSLSEIEPLCVCAWSNDSHLIIIDKVHSIDANKAVIDICQSSGSVKTSKLITVTATGDQLDGDPKTKGLQPYSFWGTTVGNPKIFLLDAGGQVPVNPYVVIGKLPGLTLAKGHGVSASY